MPLTPKEREVIERHAELFKVPPYEKDASIPRLVGIIRRLNAESKRQRRTIEHLKRRLRAWEGT